MSEYEYAFGQVSGLRLNALSAVASRWLEGRKFDWTSGESHLFAASESEHTVDLGHAGVFASVWRSRVGTAYVAHRDGAWFCFSGAEHDYLQVRVRASLLGTWGIDDANVFVWGLRGDTPVMFRRAGDALEEMPAPPKLVFNMAGDRPDRLLAVGDEGMIALWNGTAWTVMDSPVGGALSSVHWVSEDEIYACGTGAQFVLEGSVYGWVKHGPFEYPLHCVAKHSGRVWVGCGLSGLHALNATRDALELVKPNIKPWHFDAREHLVMSGAEQIAATADGQAFRGIALAASYQRLVADLPPVFGKAP